MGRWMARRLDSTPAVDLITAVPLHPRRTRERGYNQAELLARVLGRHLGLPYSAVVVRRTRATPPQVKSGGRAERAANMLDAFAADRTVVGGRSILVIDDVATTGATLSACARALKDAGAARVTGLTLAREV